LCAAVAHAETEPLDVEGMTFVSTRDDRPEVVLRAREAQFQPDTDRATLQQVRALVTAEDESSFEVTCDRGELNLETNDFVAEGNVVGQTASGRQFRTERVEYDHARGLLHTNVPVVIEEATGTYEGGGFEYHVREDRFRLLGGARVIQAP
ncbi:MAG: LPS export ABC transporter periplasmic protein LptC, partial [Proteobacteria bacterium]|nr:LPS export ABC transporter periplasmic protein LptC [Pseudomonadota bacterium]